MQFMTRGSKVFIGIVLLAVILAMLGIGHVPFACAVLHSAYVLDSPGVSRHASQSQSEAVPLSPLLSANASRAPPALAA